jgi:hypothetical protein
MAAIKNIKISIGLKMYLKLIRVKAAYNKVRTKSAADTNNGHETTGASACQNVKLYRAKNRTDTHPDMTGAYNVNLLTDTIPL